PESQVTAEVASCVMQRLLVHELKLKGFRSVESQDTLDYLEHHAVTFIQELYSSAHLYANLANRANPIASDLLHACQDGQLETKSLRRKSKKRKRCSFICEPSSDLIIHGPIQCYKPAQKPVSKRALEAIPATLRDLPSHFPKLPPKHTYMRTPVSVKSKSAQPPLEKKLKNASLVQESLRNLMTNTGQEDENAELLGHIVNWETTNALAKRWRV
ncbi:hypothetical protein FISHEDRAFT_24529, partial [Fistulina hepatica ATCC 64428]